MQSDGHNGAYPSGTSFEADVFYALQSLVPRTNHLDGSNPVLERTTAIQQPTGSPPSPRAPKTRFKPTLNCDQCVQRKTKCDRARPSCLGCIRRAQPCTYNALAEILHASAPTERKSKRQKNSHESQHHDSPEQAAASASRDLHSGPAHSSDSGGSSPPHSMITHTALNLVQHPVPSPNTASSAMRTKSPSQRRIIQPPPLAHSVALPPHPIAAWHSVLPTLVEAPADHLFRDRSSAGISQIMKVMPSKTQASALCDIYMRCIDPIIPVLSARDFLEAHEAFWTDSNFDKSQCDPAQLALFLGVYACAAQQSPDMDQRDQAQMFLCACHEALGMSNYLQLHSIGRAQVLLLISHYFINDGRLIEAWTLAGLNQRQACSLALGRPSLGTQACRTSEEWQGAQLWAALCHQDNMLTFLLKMSRSIVRGVSGPALGSVLTAEDQRLDEQSHERSQAATDRCYHTALSKIGAVASEHICSTNGALSSTATTKAVDARRIIDLLQATFDSVEAPFQNLDSFWVQSQEDSRVARQGVELMSVFHFYMMLALHMSEEIANAIPSDELVHCFHEGLAAFFALSDLDPYAARKWSICHTLSYLQAMALGKFLGRMSRDESSKGPSKKRDPLLMLAKSDFDRYLEALTRESNRDGMLDPAADRVRQLRELRTSIRAV